MPYKSALIKILIENFRWDKMNHEPYLPDPTPSDFHAIPELKIQLHG